MITGRSGASLLSALFIGLCLAPIQAAASPIFQIANGTLTLTGLFGGVNPILDVRGAVLLNVSDTGLPPSPMAIFDPTGGNDPTASVVPFGNSFMIADDAASAVSGVRNFLFFDFAHAIVPSGTEIIIPATVSINPSGSTPDAILAALLNASPVAFHFNYSAYADLGGGNAILQWQLASVNSVPEPASCLLIGTGMVALAGVRLRKRAAQRS